MVNPNMHSNFTPRPSFSHKSPIVSEKLQITTSSGLRSLKISINVDAPRDYSTTGVQSSNLPTQTQYLLSLFQMMF